MDTITCFTILSYNSGRGYFDTPQPSFLMLAMVMELEARNKLHFTNGSIKIIGEEDAPHLSACLEAIQDGSTVVQFLDSLLRGFTFNKLDELIKHAVTYVANSYDGVTEKKGKFTINDDLKRQAQSSLVLALGQGEFSGIATATLLYGCRTLQDHLGKTEYKSTVALIKNGFNLDSRPLTSYILNNIDLIRGHIMGIVAN